MNYNDIYEEAVSIKLDIERIRKTIYDVNMILKYHKKWAAVSYNFLLNFRITGSDNTCVKNAEDLRSRASNHHKEIINSLIKIDFRDLWMTLADMKKYDKSELGIDIFLRQMGDAYEVIHQYKTVVIDSNIESQYIKLIDALNTMVNEFSRLENSIKTIEGINYKLTLGTKESTFSIRFLAENNELGTTLESMKSLEDMYKDLCSIIGISHEQEPIMYNRIESGTFLAFLSGNAVALGILGAIIKFSYDVYKDQFSWQARQDRALGEIKVRGEYIRLIKEQQELNIEGNPDLQNKLAKLEENNIKLFSNNPSIILNGENIGIPSMANEKIPETLLLRDEQKKIEDKSV